jgi:hypothetical protein
VVLQLKSAFKDGTTHIVMSPLQFMQRLAALVPRPRLHLIRFHGVLAPNAKPRREIVPSPPEQATAPARDHARGAPARLSWARPLKRVFDIDIEHCPNCGGSLKSIACPEPSSKGRPRRSASDCQNPRPSGPAHPRTAARPSTSSRSIPDDLSNQKCLPTQADGAARSDFEPLVPQRNFRAPPDRSRGEPQRYNSGVLINHKRELTSLPVQRYDTGHRKGRLKFLSFSADRAHAGDKSGEVTVLDGERGELRSGRGKIQRLTAIRALVD